MYRIAVAAICESFCILWPQLVFPGMRAMVEQRADSCLRGHVEEATGGAGGGVMRQLAATSGGVWRAPL